MQGIVLTVNGKAVPFDELEFDFSSGRYLMGYLSLFQGTDTLYSNHSMGLTTEYYKNGHTIYAFDLETKGMKLGNDKEITTTLTAPGTVGTAAGRDYGAKYLGKPVWRNL